RETPVLLVANKTDELKHEAEAYEMLKLGFGEPLKVSATTGHNRFELFRAIRERIDFTRFEDRADEAGVVKLALVGKRNAGKSTMVNALARDDRVIVSEQEGTTRDAVDVRFEYDGRSFMAIDTAGLRKRKSMADDIEYYSHHRALRSVRRADVCLLVIDATVSVSQVDRQLAHEILKHHRPTIIVVNKWDLTEAEFTQEQFVEYLDNALKGLSFAPIAFVSAHKGEGMAELLETAAALHEQAGVRLGTAELNEVMEELMSERGPAPQKGRRARIYYATQVETHPPTIALFVNNPDLVDDNYQRFLLNKFHELLPYTEVPIKLLIRGRQVVRGSG
ncbi:MAG: ribosome biogenesis GTPase Der, partial [Phycisphaeraceae bacterium]